MWLLVPDSPKDPGYRKSLARIRTEAERCLTLFENSTSIYAGTLQAVERVSHIYAAGAPILFRGAHEELAFGMQCVGLLEDVCRTHAGGDPTEPPAGVRIIADALVALWVDQARIDLHGVRGEHGEVERIIERRTDGLRRR
jgi:hypothetical protein